MRDLIAINEYIPLNKCAYCGKQFGNFQAIRSHLRACKKRAVMRYYICNEYIFGLLCNPAVKFLSAIENEIIVSGDPKLVLGAIRAYQHNGHIHSYIGIEHKSKDLKNGSILSFKDLMDKLTPSEFLLLQTERNEIITEFIKNNKNIVTVE